MKITTDIVKALRDQTGVSVMQCKKALEEAGGDMEKAHVILRKQSSSIASKKADRTLGAGIVSAYTHAGGAVVGTVVLLCETDFVAKNEDFKKLAYDIAMHVAAMNPQFLSRNDVRDEDTQAARSVFEGEVGGVAEGVRAQALEGKMNAYLKERVLLEQPFVKDATRSVQDLVESAIQKFGEKIQVVRYERLSVK
ncbi:MAG TPA: elongation factor Ts [Candidatus Paceibacterota bacterium]